MQYTIKKNKIIINTLSKDNQNCLIKNTLSVNNEVEVINKLISESDLDEIIIIYGENSSDNKIYEKYKQLLGLGLLIFMFILADYSNGFYYKIFMEMICFQQQKYK